MWGHRPIDGPTGGPIASSLDRLMFACLYALDHAVTGAAVPMPALVALAREWSPRVEAVRPDLVVLDARGLTRLFGDPQTLAFGLARAGLARGWRTRVAVAATRTAAMLLALGRPGVSVVPAGGEAAALAGLPLALLAEIDAAKGDMAAGRPAVRDGRRGVEGTRSCPRGRASSARHDHFKPVLDRASGVGEGGGTAGRARGEGSGDMPPPAAEPARTAGVRAVEALALLQTLSGWGLRTLGDLAALPVDDLAARLGEAGSRWHRLARGQDDRPLVGEVEEPRFEASLDLDWPVEGLEPLSFVLGRLFDSLAGALARAAQGAVGIETRLDLVTRQTHVRALHLPAPMADPKVLRTLVLLDLEAHPPPAAIDRVTVTLEPAPARAVQYSLLARPLPAPDRLATLMARLGALVGEEHVGHPVLLDSHRPGAFDLAPFAPSAAHPRGGERCRAGREDRPLAVEGDVPVEEGGRPSAVLRRFRRPIAARVVVEGGRPVRLVPDRAGLMGGRIVACAGPWRTSGAWWRLSPGESAWAGAVAGSPGEAAHPGAPTARSVRGGVEPGAPTARSVRGGVEPGAPTARGTRAGPWSLDEWDVATSSGVLYRLAHDRARARWFIEGLWD
jgi:hypothetical protein